MTDRILCNGSCYAPFLIREGMKREDIKYEDELKVFDFADKDGNGILNGEEYNRAVCASGYYPGYESENSDAETFKDIDTNNDGKLSKEEMEEYVNIEIKNKQILEEFREKNTQIEHHDEEGSVVLGTLGVGLTSLAAYSSRQVLPSAKEYENHGIKLRFPKLHDKFNKGSLIFSKIGIGVGLLITAACITDVFMGNKAETQRKKLMGEYSDKMYAVVEENPDSRYAKKCYKELEEYFAVQADESNFSVKQPWDD